MSSGPAHMVEISEKCQWDRCQAGCRLYIYTYKLDQLGCLTQAGWKSPCHACAKSFDAETAYDTVIGNGQHLNLDVKHKINKWE